ncbi:hypothetical protein J3A84_09065 [Proteiniclasticum sp. SCR006]|uniref:Uncharacterized protein n=1 Tax=Proteiniclasticum aestuarii TaxID=2817862 RepID=A0A939HCS6_9CLOT|nr:hypothetical protein [Proteiniclasticum aestuarii]MBO1265175.1 hypothetical protein [Proteiniclasticum aestuarii]
MSRTLITRQNYREFLAPDGKSVNICSGMILTPGAKDFLREQQIRIIYEDQKKEEPGRKCSEEVKDCPLTDRVYRMMKEEFGTDDRNLAQKIARLITIE